MGCRVVVLPQMMLISEGFSKWPEAHWTSSVMDFMTLRAVHLVSTGGPYTSMPHSNFGNAQ
jgi:hypothetical protein